MVFVHVLYFKSPYQYSTYLKPGLLEGTPKEFSHIKTRTSDNDGGGLPGGDT